MVTKLSNIADIETNKDNHNLYTVITQVPKQVLLCRYTWNVGQNRKVDRSVLDIIKYWGREDLGLVHINFITTTSTTLAGMNEPKNKWKFMMTYSPVSKQG